VQVAALSLRGVRRDSLNHYREDLSALLKESAAALVVLPAYSALLLALETGRLAPGEDFPALAESYRAMAPEWNVSFLELHRDLARRHNLYLVCGTLFEEEGGCWYHTAYCCDPRGEISGRQRQTHLDREQRELGLSRGEELEPLPLEDLRLGILVANDVRHPETGRILALQGVDLVVHCGALPAGANPCLQVAGLWSQVQQNQFWGVEAQLSASLGRREFSGECAVLAPCEITEGQTGYLARSGPEAPLAAARLDREARREIMNRYPLLKLLNPRAYRGHLY